MSPLNVLRDLRLAIGFLTLFPVAPDHAEEMGPSRAYFPLVGLALGGILAGIDFAARQVLPDAVVAALLVAALLLLTRAIHTEGFLDACDGMLGGYSRERRLEILRDTHVGAFAVAGGISLLLLKWSLFANVPDGTRAALIGVFPCLSRFGMVTTMAAFGYVREKGLGTAFQDGASPWQVIFGFVTAAVAAGLLLGAAGLFLLGGAIVVSLAVGWWTERALGGATGDVYGAVNEVTEVTVLLIGVAVFASAPELYQPPLW